MDLNAKNGGMGRREFLCSAAAGVAVAPGVLAAQTEASSMALRTRFQGKPLIGVALPNRFLQQFSTVEMGLLERHFDSITPENCMKWQMLAREQGTYNLGPVDDMVAYAQSRNMSVVGHTLLFNRKGNYPDWLFKDGDKQASARLVWERIEAHMGTLMGRYRGKIDSWDVLNEFVEVKDPGYRHTEFTEVLGPDYPIRLFKMAAEMDPKAKLTYNDFGIEMPKRRAKILEFVKKLQDAGCRIDVVGSQSHLEIGREVGEELSSTITEFAALGVKCAFTELDVDVVPRGMYWNMKTRPEALTHNPYPDACPDEILEQQAKVYADVFKAVTSNPKWVDRVTLWGLTDKYSWLNNWPWKRTNHGLLFDRDGQPKPALDAILSAKA